MKKVIMTEEHIFVTGFCCQYMTVFLTQNLHDQKICVWHAIMATQTAEPISFKTLLLKRRRETFWATTESFEQSIYFKKRIYI
jgi:uncharacterized iron-regulated protein